jgi:hypothetical protein
MATSTPFAGEQSPRYPFPSLPCSRCGGTGYFGHYGVCFLCGGACRRLTRIGEKAHNIYLRSVATTLQAMKVGSVYLFHDITGDCKPFDYKARVLEAPVVSKEPSGGRWTSSIGQKDGTTKTTTGRSYMLTIKIQGSWIHKEVHDYSVGLSLPDGEPWESLLQEKPENAACYYRCPPTEEYRQLVDAALVAAGLPAYFANLPEKA